MLNITCLVTTKWSYRNGGYLKAGLGPLDVTADIPSELNNSTQVSLGVGLE
jgi:hypothetical protein